MKTNLDALLCEVTGGSLCQICRSQSVAERLDGSIDCDDTACALGRYVQVVGDGACCHFEDGIRCRLIQEDAAKSRQKGPRWATD